MTVFLCGFMGCGKSCTGKRLSEKLGTKFIDMDDYIVNREGMSIPDIFSQKGEKYFRAAESASIIELSHENAVIACGGGAMLSDENAENAGRSAAVIFIDVPFEICYSRIKDDPNRPIAVNNSKDKLLDIYTQRRSIYIQHSQITVDASAHSADEVSSMLEQAVIKLSETRRNGGFH
ncbi:MAG: shikimate kinase [Oscillospiraceae bacterium]|nr:shikimate kinase [Oscillospiraceae bacterium]